MPPPLATPKATVTLRPEITSALMDRTGLNDAVLTRLVHGFYDRIRRDALLGPIFAERITDWPPHLDRMVDFWSSVALMTGRYHGSPMQAHLGLPVEQAHFDRWLDLFSQTARETCPPEGAAHVGLMGVAEGAARQVGQRLDPCQPGAFGTGVEFGGDTRQGIDPTAKALDILIRKGRELRQRGGKCHRHDQPQQPDHGAGAGIARIGR